MSALEEVLHGIDHCLRRIGDAKSALARALEALEAAGAPDGLGVLLGSRDPDAQHALASTSHAAEDVVLLHQVLVRLEARILAGRAALAGGTAPVPGSTPVSGSATSLTERERNVRRARGELPRSRPGGRMHGRYVAEDGHDQLTSGPTKPNGSPDKDWRMACSYLADLAPDRFSTDHPPMFAQHIEAKFAMRMWRERITDADIVIERRPCGADAAPEDVAARLTCARWLARMIPPGTTLRVTSRDGITYTYRRPRRTH